VYGKIWEQLALISQCQIWGTRPASPRSPSKYEYNITQFFFIIIVYRNEIVGVEQSFTVFLHAEKQRRGRSNCTSAMEFFLRDNTFHLFQGMASAPLTHTYAGFPNVRFTLVWRGILLLISMFSSGEE